MNMDTFVTSNIVTITMENFQQVILEDSKSKLILVDFWAEQVPESIELRDKLATRVAPYGEHMVLATVDCQAQQQIAMQFGIQGLPTAVIVKDGQPIDGISGPQTDESIEEFLNKHLPKPEDTLLKQAREYLANNDVNQAYGTAAQAYQLDSDRADIKLVYADVSIQLGKITEAQTLLDSIKMVDQDSDYQAVVAKLELASQAADSPEIKALEAQLALSSPAQVFGQQSYQHDLNLAEQLASQNLVWLVPGWEPPTGELTDLLRVNSHHQYLLLVALEPGDDSLEWGSWQHFIEQLKRQHPNVSVQLIERAL